MASPTSTYDMQKYFIPTSTNSSPPASSVPCQPSINGGTQCHAPNAGVPSSSFVPSSSPSVGPGTSPSSTTLVGGHPPQLVPASSFPPPSAPGSHLSPGQFPASYIPNQLHPHFQLMPPYPPSIPPIDHVSPISHHHSNHSPSNPNNHYPTANPHHYSIPQRSLSYPTPTLQPHSQLPPFMPQRINADRSGAEITALLRPTAMPGTPSPPDAPSYPQVPPIVRIPSSVGAKQPRGRKIPTNQSCVEYDVDVRLPGEVQPQLEVTPITKYVTDPQLCLGRQIAVNRWYICYGLKQGNIRILNINTALRSIFRTHSQRVTDMAFFAEDVHLLASAGVDGRVVVWKISEDSDEEDKPQITGKTVIAVQISGIDEIKSPRICWHCYKQEILVVGVGKYVLRIDTNRVGKADSHSPEVPLQCPIDNLPEVIQLVGNHEGEVTDLSMCQWMTTRLVSASTDGTIKIWEDNKDLPLVVLMPYEGQPVFSAMFLTAPNKPDHIVLVTAGPLNREVKIWVSANEEGWLLPRDTDVLTCIQTLELKSSVEPQPEEAFFNQTLALSQIGIILFANAKKDAIYVLHIDYGVNPAATRMDYVSEFSVAIPILSLTGTSDVQNGQSVAQIYCVQTQAIQQYTLHLSQCSPPDSDNIEKSDSTENFETFISDGYPTQNIESVSVPSISPHGEDEDLIETNKNFDGELESQDKIVSEEESISKSCHSVHLVTPSEILIGAVMVNFDSETEGIEEPKPNHEESNGLVIETKEKIFCSQVSGLGIEMARDCQTLTTDTHSDEIPEPSGSAVETQERKNAEEMINQLMNSQKDMQNSLLDWISGSISKECKKMEIVFGKNIEKVVKSNMDTLWACLQEENAKNEKRSRERTQQMTNFLTNFINKDMPALVEKAVKKEFTRSISPLIEKTLSSAISESFQKGVGDKAVAQLEKSVSSKLEATVARQIQSQFQTSGKQALQETMKLVLESLLVPAFDKSCKAMFEQVDATFQKGLTEHITSAQHHLDSSHSQLAFTLRDVLNSASSLTQSLNSELVENQRKLIAVAAARANSGSGVNPLIMQLSNGPASVQEVEAKLDPTKEINKLISERKYDEAFNFTLQLGDVSMVSWLCSQVDLHDILSMDPVPFTQGVLLSLLQQLGCDIGRDTGKKLAWMTDVASAIIPNDPAIAVHIRPISEQVLHLLQHIKSTASLSGAENSSLRVLLHVISSLLASCK